MYWGSQYNKLKVVGDMQLAIDNQPDYARSIIVSDIDLDRPTIHIILLYRHSRNTVNSTKALTINWTYALYIKEVTTL